MNRELYCFGESGASYKIALTLEILKLDWTPIFVDFFKGETRSAPFREEINSMGECPVYIENGQSYAQSGVILKYLSEQHGQLGGTTAQEMRSIDRWILWDNHKLSSQVGVLRFLKNFLPAENRSEDVINFMTARAQAALQILELELADKDWLVGEKISIADISCCSYLYYPEEFGFTRSEYPNIDRWLTRISNQAGWKHPYDLMKPAFPKTT